MLPVSPSNVIRSPLSVASIVPTSAPVAAKVGAELKFANQDFQCFEQYGRMVFQDENGLLDLDLPSLLGRFQIDNAGLAIAAIRALDDQRITTDHIAAGLADVRFGGNGESNEMFGGAMAVAKRCDRLPARWMAKWGCLLRRPAG